MPIDTLVYPRGILQLPFMQKKMNIEVSLDWSTITLYEVLNGEYYQIPFTSSLFYFIQNMQKQKWHLKLLEVMQKKKKMAVGDPEEKCWKLWDWISVD